uniref:Polypeptide N-acetylgalactosaminyltransferase n=1 Tax=Gadus morhua TaxID=8049 RepID=A0A8C5APE3_GADMO
MMALYWRRIKLKSIFLLFGACFVGYLLFMRNSSDSMSSTRRRDAPGPQDPETDEEFLTKPVYEKPPLDVNGLGELGRAVKLDLQGEDKKKEQESIDKHQINIYVSDKISLHRRLSERRNPLCKEVKYDYRSLPTTSVVIAFYNEAWSTLLRTVHSVLETSPDILLKEIILVDDYSDRAHLKAPLEAYISGWRKVRLIRANKREGLVRARLLGASISTGDVLTFLDCHCECHTGWLEPLLQRIKEEPSAVVCPVIDVIDWNTFQYLGNAGEPQIGGFDWRLVFTWHVVPPYEQQRRRSPIDVIRSPTMAGGLFAVKKDYFLYLGTYDTGMEVWGGENLEFSFRIWQCGGTLEVHPCSHVGHIFPKKAPYSRSKALSNSVRAAEVWMDDYKNLYYHRNPHARLEAFGDVTARLQLRQKLGCKSFKWFLDTIYPDLSVPEDRPGMFGMFFEFTSAGEIQYNTRAPEGCAAVDNVSTYLTVMHCSGHLKPVPPDQKFEFRKDGTLFHPGSNKCLEAVSKTDNGKPAPGLRTCSDSANQHWVFEERMP